MSRFNTTSTGTKTVNLAGGQAYSQSPELELISILLTSFANEQFYRSAKDTFETLKNLIPLCDKQFVAQAAIYARTKFGMRSITHVLASELAKHISGEAWAKDFYSAIVYRPDDMMEILSYHKANNGKIPNAIKRGFAKAFDKFDAYQLAKYRGENKGFKLVDIVNLVHPLPTDKNKEAIAALIKGDLRSIDTWEAELTKAGQSAANDDEKAEFKKEVWIKLITEKKIGYFALLRNLRNIVEQAPEIIPAAIETLTNPHLIKKSLVLPFRFLAAYNEVQKLNVGRVGRDVLMALSQAVDLSLANVPKFDGNTLVVLDVSGSMEMTAAKGIKSPHVIGALFAATLCKANNCDLMTFDNTARYVNINPLDAVLSITNDIPFTGGGTDFHSIFKVAKHKYDRIVILSDMQGWVGYYAPTTEYNQYKKATGATPIIYSFDLNNYGTMQFPEKNVFCIAGFSDKIFDVMSLLEQDKNALVNDVKKIEF